MTSEALPPSPPDPVPVPAPAPVALPAPAVPARQTSALAITSLVCGVLGILGWVLVAPILASIAAVVTGHMARANIRHAAGTLDGDGMAIAGLVTGYLMIGLSVLTILAFVLFFGGLAVLLGLLGISGQL